MLFEKNLIRDDEIVNITDLNETIDYWQYFKCKVKVKFGSEAI
jgi:hypothetical protein